jgi:acetyl-CoA/propionyl-CoA carboxylase, biotin carboxylase, biotin carboxyl carrier protein
VEFITPKSGLEFFFVEMNTRLQVEHPVTELVYGLDLVEQQLRVAQDLPLDIRQDELHPAGHAIEVRLYAEDPSRGFLPSTGTVRAYSEPTGPGVRVDSGVRAGAEVSTAYDPLLAKVIAHGPTRETALQRLDRALATFDLVGVSTNAAFTRELLAREDVRSGDLDTELLERALDDLSTDPPADLVPAAMVAAAGTADPEGPWRRALTGHGDARIADGLVTIGEDAWQAAIRGDLGALRISLDGIERRYVVAVSDQCVWIARDGHHLEVRTAPIARADQAALGGSLEAPMPGAVLLVSAANGDHVEEGDVLVVLESMKMELSIAAPRTGVVAGLEVRPGDRVALGQPLVSVVDPDEAPE